MSLEKLLDEVRQKGESAISAERAHAESLKKSLFDERDRRIANVTEETRRRAAREAERERGQRLAGAKVQGRRLEFEARERRVNAALNRTREELQAFTQTSQYEPVLRRMYDYAVSRLGSKIKVFGRVEDASLLKGIAGRTFQPQPASVSGGLIAESPDGNRRLDLSFDALLRRNEDAIRQLVED